MQEVVAKLKSDPSWRGERQEGSGPPRKTTPAQDEELVQLLIDERGNKKVTVPFLKRPFSWAERLSDSCVADRLHEAGLKFMRRRRKSIVLKTQLKPRVRYSKRVLKTDYRQLRRVAYTDGTTFYLDRNGEDHEHNQRAALGIARAENVHGPLIFMCNMLISHASHDVSSYDIFSVALWHLCLEACRCQRCFVSGCNRAVRVQERTRRARSHLGCFS